MQDNSAEAARSVAQSLPSTAGCSSGKQTPGLQSTRQQAGRTCRHTARSKASQPTAVFKSCGDVLVAEILATSRGSVASWHLRKRTCNRTCATRIYHSALPWSNRKAARTPCATIDRSAQRRVTPASGKDAPRFFRSVCKTTGQAQASNAVTQHPNLQNHSTDANQ